MIRSFQRPENALKRAHEFLDVGKPNRALEVLYEVIKRGKARSNYSEKLLEPIMIKYLELCVDLKKSHLAKEGLYQYRNIFQSVNVSSLESVVRYYLKLADERTETARAESHQAVVDIDDLDNPDTPEELLLSAVSGEGAQDRSDRTILTPWVKFLWESYRQCLELLRTNSRVERLYHDIAKQAFKFCDKYSRKTEFRKLCDNLRTHLILIQKQQGSATAVNLNNPETQQMNLETRLEQLNYAIKMELWQEAYKAIEDISDLMSKSRKMPKPHVMASYYNKLSLVFWKAGNLLFHTAALFKLFQLLRDQKKNMTAEELSKMASSVLVATLAVPLPSAHPEFDRFIESEKSSLEKVEKLSNLLSLPKPPTRGSLVKDLMRYNVVSAAAPELQSLYNLMEVEFVPLHLCTRMQAHFTWIQEHSDLSLAQYIPPLQEMTITRLVKQISQIYQTITFKRLLDLSVFVTPFSLERILVDLVRHNSLQIRIDHRSGCVNFGADLSESQREDLSEGPTIQELPSETIRCQLVSMSSVLQQCLALIVPDKKKKEMEPLCAQTIHLYQQTKQREHRKILQRQHIIEERKEMLENQNLEREESIRRAQEEQLKRQKEEEQERLKREASKREKQRQEEQLKQIHTKQIKDKLLQIRQTSYGQKMIEKFDEEELLKLDAEEILQRQVEELDKERRELQQKLKLQEKKIDHLERAKRLVEIPLLKEHIDKQKELDREFWKLQEKQRIAKLTEEHRVSLENSKRLQHMQKDKDIFMERLKAARRSEMEKKLNEFNARLDAERRVRLAERKEQRKKERREAYVKQKAEDEQRRKDEELKKQREEQERHESEERRKLEESYARQSKIQREKERQVEEKLEREKTKHTGAKQDTPEWRRGVEQEETSVKTNDDDEPTTDKQPWKPSGGSWKARENAKMDTWRSKDNREQSNDKDFDDKRDDRDNRCDIKRDGFRKNYTDCPYNREKRDFKRNESESSYDNRNIRRGGRSYRGRGLRSDEMECDWRGGKDKRVENAPRGVDRSSSFYHQDDCDIGRKDEGSWRQQTKDTKEKEVARNLVHSSFSKTDDRSSLKPQLHKDEKRNDERNYGKEDVKSDEIKSGGTLQKKDLSSQKKEEIKKKPREEPDAEGWTKVGR